MSNPPFVAVEGSINFRGVGGFAVDLRAVKPNLFYRSGDLSQVTEAGKQKLRELGIRQVFDLRKDVEIASFNAPPLSAEGITCTRLVISETSHDPVSLASRLKEFDTDELNAFLSMYLEMLEDGTPTYGTLVRHVMEYPNSPCLVHCTGGKDRTGIFAAVILMALGVSDADIIADYALTTVGLAPALPLMMMRLEKHPAYMGNVQGAIKMGSSRPETMSAFLDMIRTKYGGGAQYLQTRAGFSGEDIQKLKDACLVG
ncbi:hypothetical protein FISHEDRAFT_70702 [Fistulina hepatica ATCC 64428]|uniref:Tyrosine specific protein phosphatases domain-containing protein n=1 Tax=Fistulina hepatica ATCC 64428 TaxID=1128425 RepID=A0A0D7AHW9_9AGAR|nr:hypothetical protein FISHEDRAFT_70702 [Fistulina hepatica ATCC 64428]